MAKAPIKRCAVYTRKSSEEGLEQDFNSLHAQREACEAFIRSQRSEGWKLVETAYDDGGISGGTMERPALRRLLADIQAGRIDIIVVYKVDRLTRSLADFAKMVELFDGHGVSFVAVTQQFNTTSSMGRLTLNILLSFAQFEREVTGERIRDKIAASKRKGMWMGGHAPLGYDAQDRRLVVNPTEAETVRMMFRRYLDLGSVRLLKNELDRTGILTKARVTPDGKEYGAQSFSRGALYPMLANPIYVGEIKHKDQVHPGQHEPILDRETWDAVQQALTDNSIERGQRATKVAPSPLVGRLVDETGRKLTPSHAVKNGRRYRYYVSPQLVTGSVEATPGWRLPAGEIEKAVAHVTAALLRDERAILEAAQANGIEAMRLPALIEQGRELADELQTPDQTADSLAKLVERVELTSDGLHLTCTLPTADKTEPLSLSRFIPLQIKRRGIEMKLVINAANPAPKADPALFKAIARAHRWTGEILSGQVASSADIATREGIAESYVTKIVKLAFLAPEIVTAIVEGTHAADLTADGLVQKLDLPIDWNDQKALLLDR